VKIAICDDDPRLRRLMREEVNLFYRSLDVLPVTFSYAEQLIDALETDPEDFFCIFMDIELEGMDGMTASRLIQEKNLDIPIILLSSHSEFAMEGYEISAFRFLTKPLNRHKMAEALKALDTMQIRNRKMVISHDGQDVYIPYKDICFIKIENVYLRIQLERQYYLIRDTLKKCMNRLPTLLFCQVHRSYVVNLQQVKSFDGAYIIMCNGNRIPVSRNKQKVFKDCIARFLKEC